MRWKSRCRWRMDGRLRSRIRMRRGERLPRRPASMVLRGPWPSTERWEDSLRLVSWGACGNACAVSAIASAQDTPTLIPTLHQEGNDFTRGLGCVTQVLAHIVDGLLRELGALVVGGNGIRARPGVAIDQERVVHLGEERLLRFV